MKITDVDVFAVKGRHWPRFPMVFVEVHTDEGLTGLGEALPYQATGLIESLRQMGEMLRGRMVGRRRTTLTSYRANCTV